MNQIVTNRIGYQYEISPISDHETRISLFDLPHKSITIPYGIDEVMRAWYKWINGHFIQDAFWFLSEDDREFLMSGLSASEFKELYSDDK